MSTKKDKFSSKDKFYMELALDLAKSRHGQTGSNPNRNRNQTVQINITNESINKEITTTQNTRLQHHPEKKSQ